MKQFLRFSLGSLILLLSVLTVQAQAPTPSSLNHGLVAWLQLDEQAGTRAQDASGAGKSGQVVNGGNWHFWGKIRHCVRLNNGAALQIPLAWQPTAFTVSWWVYADAGKVGNWTQTVGSSLEPENGDAWHGFLFHTSAAGRIYAGTDWNSHLESADNVFRTSVWQHFVFTFNKGESVLYKDGNRIAYRSNGTILPAAWQKLSFGSTKYSNLWAEGYYDDIRVYDRALTAAEVTQLAASTAGVYTPPTVANENLDRNWSSSRSFDGEGNVIGESKSFADALGRPTQAQVKSQTTGHVLATQTIYSYGGKPVLATLAAPTDNTAFSYKDGFLTSGGANYGAANFQNNTNNPAPADQPTTPGSVGYYYSDKNTLEPLTATTNYPFSLTEEYGGPLGGVKRSTSPGDAFRMGLGREAKGREFPLLNELDHYLSLRPQFVPGSSAVASLRLKGEKAVSVNADGVESLSFSDADGKLLATCLSGPQYPALTLTAAIHSDPANAGGIASFQDIHVPAAGPANLRVTGSGAIRVLNLQTEVISYYSAPWPAISLAPGFYRVLSDRDNQALSYEARYGEFSYSYYDDAGRVVATIAPKGINRINLLRNPGFEQDPSSSSTPTGWQNTGAAYTEPGQPHSGSLYGVHWSSTLPYSASTTQVVSGLSNGLYTLRAWIRNTGDQTLATMVAENNGGAARSLPIPVTYYWGPWTLIELRDIAVSNGQCQVGFRSASNVNAWILFDDVELVRQDDGAAPQFVTRNTYSGAGTLLATESIDEGKTEYVYARDGRIRFSQSALQKLHQRFSYSHYDEVGRVVESGEYQMASGQGHVFENQIGEKTPLTNSVLKLLEERLPVNSLDLARCSQRNQVWYDLPTTNAQNQPDVPGNGRTQEFVLGAVAKTSNGTNTTWYSYDELGRVTWLVQQVPGVGIKTVDYIYDFAGNVLEVAYQKGQPDAFFHHYAYDADQRLRTVHTSPDGLVANRTLQATYSYYLHGPLKRVELADRLQGIDYAYTVQGWLKSINNVEGKLDPGQDSPKANGVLKDLFALRLDYFDGDFRSRQLAAPNLTSPANQQHIRYDGTVRASTWRTAAAPTVHGYAYRYDAKGQLLQSDYGQLTGGNSLSYDPGRKKFEEGNLSYDAHGNILSLRRRNGNGDLTDDFAYQYTAGTNKLHTVSTPAGANVLSYEYDAIGQMTREAEAGKADKYLRYDVTGKVTGVYRKANFTEPVATYTYDDRGFRSSKVVYTPQYAILNTTHYVTDAQGSVLSTYEQPAGKTLERTEVPLYGSGRVGTLTRLDDGTLDARYELNDQLGNARVIFHKPKTTKYLATVNLSLAQQEEREFTNLPATRWQDVARAYDDSYVARLGGAGEGPKKRLPVAKGDTVTFTAQAMYLALNPPPPGSGGLRIAPVITTGTPMPPLPGSPTTPGTEQQATRPSRLRSLSFGVALIGLGNKNQNRTTTTTLGSPAILVRYRYYNTNNELKAEGTKYLTTGPEAWEQLQVGFRAPDAGTVELTTLSFSSDWQTYFDHVEVEHTGSIIVQEQHQYAFGSPLTGLNYTIDNKVYRHGYQGKFAEKDAETGYDSFELRLYNSRIGRWTSYDPEGQFYSPYVGMGNNPVSSTDPTGGLAGPNIFSYVRAAMNNTNVLLRGGQIAGFMSQGTLNTLRALPSVLGHSVIGGGLSVMRAQQKDPSAGAFYTNERAAYKQMTEIGKYKETMGWGVYDQTTGKRGVLVEYGASSSETHITSNFTPRNGTIVWKNGGKTHILTVVFNAHTHNALRNRNGNYQGPSGPGNAAGGGRGDLGLYEYLNTNQVPPTGLPTPINVFVIGPTEVSKLNPNANFRKDSNGRNPHYWNATDKILDPKGPSLFNP